MSADLPRLPAGTHGCPTCEGTGRVTQVHGDRDLPPALSATPEAAA